MGTWTVTADNGAEVVRTRANSTSGSGNATIAVSFPDNMSGTAPKTYNVTVSLDSDSQALIANYEPLTFKITQKVPEAINPSLTISTNNSTVTNNSYSDENVAISFTGINSTNRSYIELNKTNSSIKVSTKPDSTKPISKIVIYWSTNYANTTTDPNNSGTVTNGTTSTIWEANNNNNSTYEVRLNLTRTSGNTNSRIRISSIDVTYLE